MLRGFFNGIKDLIYPNLCLTCKNRIVPAKGQNLVCAQCWEKIEKNLPPFCASCGRRLDKLSLAKNICSNCLKFKFHFDRAFSPCTYTGIIKKLIHEFKYSGKDYLGEPLGDLMNKFIKDYRLPIEYIDFIIPIPLHKSRMREREFNQAQILSEQIAKEFNTKILPDALVRTRPTRTQTELAFEERRKNVEKSFTVNDVRSIKDANLLLIDDVLTTGATSSEAARVLKDSGARIIFVMTLAN
ncbi:MAG: ComF family protein [Candidatus Omnitrophica bacterium]|nr:ComF family protein [Candidatus Omnitrophota bacterium]MBU1922653.1 ComF family protein [Candidatus Omnitrophota bacterium]